MAILVSARLMLLLLFIGVNNAQLSTNFYSSTCPQLLPTITSVVRSAISADPRMGASLLRLHFSDCFVNGCDASVLLDDTPSFTGEKTAIPNVNSLRGFDVIDNIKARVERICPGTVSCADILTVAARDSVFTLNGPSWLVLLGRRDSTTASLTDANSQIPSPDNSLAELVDAFSAKGLSRSEMVTLSGAHTIGQARCTTFRTRIYNVTNLNATYAAELRENCPSIGGDDNLSPLDVVSPTVFNNDYYKNLIGLNGLLRSDGELFNDASTEPQVQAYSTNAASFFNDFSAAMIKMSNLSPLTGTNGQIRANCRIIN